MTYGDGVSDVDIERLLAFHSEHGKLATVTAVPPPARFGALEIRPDEEVVDFREKPEGDGDMVNAGFFVLSRAVIDYIDGDQTIWERDPMERLAREHQLKAYRHRGFWQPMDTLRDRTLLEDLWARGRAPWKRWQ
jgi:glucose-1-phosphate cytidylyltransferase